MLQVQDGVGPEPMDNAPLTVISRMSYPSNKKPKKLPEPCQQHIALEVPTNTALGPPGFRAELDTDPKGTPIGMSRLT